MPQQRPVSRWPWFAAAALLAAFAAWYQVRSFDTFFHLAAGRWIAAHRVVPTVDPFSYSFPGAAWHDHSWGFQLALYGLYVVGGIAALTWAMAAISASLFALGAGRLGRHAPYLLPWALLPFVMFREVLSPRPHTLAMLATAAMAAIVELAHRHRRPALVWCLTPIHAAWCVVHGSHLLFLPLLVTMVGTATLFAWRCARQGRPGAPEAASHGYRLATHTGGVALVAAGITAAFAPDALTLGLEHLGSPTLARYVPEWQPLRRVDLLSTWPGRSAITLLALTLLGLWPAWKATADDPHARAGLAGRIAWLAVLTALGLSSRRMLVLWLFGALPVWIELVDHTLRRFARALPNLAELRPQLALVGASLFFFGLFEIGEGRIYAPGPGIDERRVPMGAVAHMKSRPELRFDRLFHAYNHGGYLMFARPDHRVLIDGRAITVYPEAFMAEFVAVYDVPERFDAYAEKYRIDAVLLPLGSKRTTPLRWYLSGHDGWRSVYEDRRDQLWVRAATVDP